MIHKAFRSSRTLKYTPQDVLRERKMLCESYIIHNVLFVFDENVNKTRLT